MTGRHRLPRDHDGFIDWAVVMIEALALANLVIWGTYWLLP